MLSVVVKSNGSKHAKESDGQHGHYLLDLAPHMY